MERRSHAMLARSCSRPSSVSRRAIRTHASVRDAVRSTAISIAIAAAVATPLAAKADLTADLLASSEANKELHDKQRLATSYANLARSRTVTDGTCAFPNNLVGCENLAELGDVKFITDDLKLECEGVADGKICPAKASGSFPSFGGM